MKNKNHNTIVALVLTVLFSNGFVFAQTNNSTLIVHAVNTESTCNLTGHYNQTVYLEGKVSQIVSGQPILIKMYTVNNSTYKLDQIPASNMTTDGLFQYIVKITNKPNMNWNLLQFVYGNQNYDINLPIQPPECGNPTLQHNENVTIVTPLLQQLESGIAAKDVKCGSNLQLVIKSEDDSPACVTRGTAQILIERGWGHYPLRLG